MVIKMNPTWILIIILISCMILLFLAMLLVFLIDQIQVRFNYRFICISINVRLENRNISIFIPFLCYCRRNNNVKITPVIPLYELKEYCKLTGNKIITNPNDEIFLGIKC